MSPKKEIVDAKMYHCGRLFRRLRHEHATSLVMAGLNGHTQLRGLLPQSPFRRALLLDGKLSGLWGYCGALACPSAYVWLVFTQEATRHPILLIKETRRQLAEMSAEKEELVTTVLEGDETALRFAAFLGFHVSGDPMGCPAHSKQGRWQLVRYARRTPEFRVPMPKGYAIRMSYHPEDSAWA